MSYAKDLYQHLTNKRYGAVGISTLTPEYQASYNTYAREAKAQLPSAVHFTLPVGGIILDDPQLRALSETEDLYLPFPSMTLEFKVDEALNRKFNDVETYSKCIILINAPLHTGGKNTEYSEQMQVLIASNEVAREFMPISVCVWVYAPRQHAWAMYPPVLLSTKNWSHGRNADGMFDFNLFSPTGAPRIHEGSSFLNPMLLVLAGFINATYCNNVDVHPMKNAASRCGKAALPFDDYYTLTIMRPKKVGAKGNVGVSDRHAPREHLRRGHIRVLPSKRRVWVNAAVINPGAAGKIHKEYKVH